MLGAESYGFLIFLARVAVFIVLWWLGWHTKRFGSPGAQINVLAALTAERTPRIAGRKQARAAAGRALHCGVDGRIAHAYKSGMWRRSGAQRELKNRIFTGRLQGPLFIGAQQAHRHHQPIGADFRNQAGLRGDAQAQQLVGFASLQ